MDYTLIILRILHIGTGVFWAGAVFFAAMFLVPATRATGPAGAPFMRQLIVAQKYVPRLAGAAVITILAGLALYGRNMATTHGAWARSRPAMAYGLGGLAAIIALIPGIMVAGRTATQLVQISDAIQASGAPPTAEQQAKMNVLRGRLAAGARWTAALLGFTVITMAIARYL